MILFLSIRTAYGQGQTGFEAYYFGGNRGASAFVPRAWWQSGSGWYTEARYNYEKANVLSVYAGRTFSGQHGVSWTLTPLAGIAGGSFNGGSVGMNAEVEKKGFSFSSNLQYTIPVLPANGKFFFSWSELGYQTGRFYAGIALQQTALCGMENEWEPGVELCFSWREWRFPFYLFDQRNQGKVVVLGVSRNWNYGK